MLLTAAAIVSFKEANNGNATFNGRIGVRCGHYLVVNVQDDAFCGSFGFGFVRGSVVCLVRW